MTRPYPAPARAGGRWAALLLAGLLACGPDKPSEPPRPPVKPDPRPLVDEAELPEAVQTGKGLYDKYCALCHGEAGVGYAADHANALANDTFLATADNGFLWAAIDRGRPGTPMAAYGARFGGPLSNDDIRHLLVYLRSLQRTPVVELDPGPVRGDPENGRAIYAKRCVGCHGPEGQGNTALSLSNPLFLATASDAYVRYAIEKGRPGTPMPAFGSELDAKAIDDLTHAIRTWARTAPELPLAGEEPPSYEQVVIHPVGPAPDFPPLREGRYLPAEVVKDAYLAGARMVILDARPTSDWLNGHIPGALPVPYYDPDRIVEALPRDGTWILSYCACPHAASGRVMDNLRAAGFENTAVIDEGILVWMERGYPTTHGSGQ